MVPAFGRLVRRRLAPAPPCRWLPHIHVKVEDTFGPKTEIRTLSFEQAPHEQPGCGEKNEAESDLGHHEESADPMTMRAR